MVKGAHTDEPDLRAMTVVAPEGHLAFWAAIDVMRTISAWHGHSLQLAAQYLYGGGFDDRV